jgi:hypothetical protein
VRLSIPLLIGALVALASAVFILVGGDGVSAPLAPVIVVGFGLGYLLRRWWWPLAPALIALALAWMFLTRHHDSPECCESDVIGALVSVIYGAVAVVAMVVGIVGRRLSDRTAPISLRRRSS